MGPPLKSCLCTQAQLESQTFQAWAEKILPTWDRSLVRAHRHRKLWEWCYIAQGLGERDMLRPGRRGLGFGVGREPLAALFASFGCEIVATDLDPASAKKAGWIDTAQHAAQLSVLNADRVCPEARFRELVTFRPVNMNAVPAGLRGFDFTWSSCSFEHLGSIKRGQEFIYNVLDSMNPGGVAIHTTEFNISSDTDTIDCGETVLFRERDIRAMIRWLHARGHAIELELNKGDGLLDKHVDLPPYSDKIQLKLQFGPFVTTSIGLIIEKSKIQPRANWRTRIARSLGSLVASR